MKNLLAITLLSIILSGCVDRNKQKEITTDNVPTGHIDSLTNEAVKNIELPQES